MDKLLLPSSGVRNSLVIERGPLAGESFHVQYHVCVNPVCRCEQMGKRCFSGPTPSSGSLPSAPICLEMDLRRHIIANLKKLEGDPNAFTLAKAIADQISEEHWTELSRLYVAEKQRQTEQADLDQIEVQFPPDVQAGDGSVVGYYELFPYARRFAATLDGTPWVLDDQYCVNPNCLCREAGLSFLKGHSALFSAMVAARKRLRFDMPTTRQKLRSRLAQKHPVRPPTRSFVK
jgi:hypothetical protein